MRYYLQGAISRQPCERLIVSPRRQIIMEGSLYLVDHNKPQEMYVILFDDMLLITRRKKGLHKKVSAAIKNWGGRSNWRVLKTRKKNAQVACDVLGEATKIQIQRIRSGRKEFGALQWERNLERERNWHPKDKGNEDSRSK